jgi:hypothetical protein
MPTRPTLDRARRRWRGAGRDLWTARAIALAVLTVTALVATAGCIGAGLLELALVAP